MLKIITTLSMVLAAHLAQAQTQVQPFTKIEAEGNVNVIIKEGPEYSVTFSEGDGNASAEALDGTLKITADAGRTATIQIAAPKVTSIRASKASIRVAGGLSQEKIAIKLTDGASISGNLEANSVAIAARSGSKVSARLQTGSFKGRFTGNSKVSLSGKADYARLDASGSTLCLARNLISQKALVRATGNSDMTVNTLGQISLSVDETAKITCIGSRTPSIDDARVVLAH